jgi:hypothetical protein
MQFQTVGFSELICPFVFVIASPILTKARTFYASMINVPKRTISVAPYAIHPVGHAFLLFLLVFAYSTACRQF